MLKVIIQKRREGMDIGLFTDTFIPIADGVGRVVLAYAETLPKLGAQVTVSALYITLAIELCSHLTLLTTAQLKYPLYPNTAQEVLCLIHITVGA